MLFDCNMKLEELKRETTHTEYAYTCCINVIICTNSAGSEMVPVQKNQHGGRDSFLLCDNLVVQLPKAVTDNQWLCSLLIAVHHFPPHQNQTCWRVLVENALCKKTSSTVRRLFPLDGLGLPLLAVWHVGYWRSHWMHSWHDGDADYILFCSAMTVPESRRLCIYIFLRVPQWHSKPDSPLQECSGCNITTAWREPVVVNRLAPLILRRVLGSALWLREWRQSETHCDMWRLRMPDESKSKKSFGGEDVLTIKFLHAVPLVWFII